MSVNAVAGDPPGTLLHVFRDPENALSSDFGASIAVKGSHVFVANRFSEQGGSVFEFDEAGNFVRRFDNPTPEPNAGFQDMFGWSMAISGDYLLVGAPFEGNSPAAPILTGAVHQFDLHSGELVRTFSGLSDDQFGFSVSATDDFWLAGSRVGVDSLRVFATATGDVLTTLHGPSAAYFGDNVLAHGDNAFVSAPQEGDFINDRLGVGSVYQFDVRSGGELIRKYDEPDSMLGMRFGNSLASLGDQLIVADTASGNTPGGTYLFDIATGDVRQALALPDIDRKTVHAYSVTAVHDLVATGSLTFQETGQIHLYNPRTGALELVIDDPTDHGGSSDHTFGEKMVEWQGRLLVSGSAGSAGGVYVFLVPEPSSLPMAAILVGVSTAILLGVKRLRR